MTAITPTLASLLTLPAAERLALAEQLYDSVDDSIPPMTDQLREELDRRLENYRKNPERFHTWESIKEEIRQRRDEVRNPPH